MNQQTAELLHRQDQLQVNRTNRGSLGKTQPPPLFEPEQQEAFFRRLFKKLSEASHHDLALNSSCSNTNPSRQVAASNGMMRSTLETWWLSSLLSSPFPSVPIGD